MPIQDVVGMRTNAEIREHVLTQGCYSREENLRIYEKWFSTAPRYVFRAVDRKYGITKGVLCDMGCSYGMNLIHCLPDSYRIEVEEYEVQFARSLGLTVYQRNILNDDLSGHHNVRTLGLFINHSEEAFFICHRDTPMGHPTAAMSGNYLFRVCQGVPDPTFRNAPLRHVPPRKGGDFDPFTT
jgi:hypothetical protein